MQSVECYWFFGAFASLFLLISQPYLLASATFVHTPDSLLGWVHEQKLINFAPSLSFQHCGQ
jgi:hypothetical protein